MTIQEVEARTGLPRATVRYYEREGLLSPQRLENGYRDYSEDNIATLFRIKLLRELGIALEDIRALQRGEAELPDTLHCRLQTLSLERDDVASAMSTCQAIWRLERPTTPWTGKHISTVPPGQKRRCWMRRRASTAPGGGIWRACWTRSSVFSCSLPWQPWASIGTSRTADVGQFHFELPGAGLNAASGAAHAALLWDDARQSHSGAPGRAAGRQPPDLFEAQSRTGQALWRGMGWNLPVLNWIRLYRSYVAHGREGEMSWDRESDFHVEAKPGAWWRNGLYVAAWAAILALIFVFFRDGGFSAAL